jgi:hypothetical protein
LAQLGLKIILRLRAGHTFHPSFRAWVFGAAFIVQVAVALDFWLKASPDILADTLCSYLTDTWSDTDKVGPKPYMIIQV